MLILLGKREELMLDKVVLKWEIETIHVPFIAVKNIWVEWAWAGEEQDCEVWDDCYPLTRKDSRENYI